MRIATLQFDARLGDVQGNIKKAEAILSAHKERLASLDLLVLPELAFAGYNHKSSVGIEPHLEPTSAGASTWWAQKTARSLGCIVAVGYAEKDGSSAAPKAYNSLVFVNQRGDIISHTRKSFLYYTDETWASEGQGFLAGTLRVESSSETKKFVAGICMDINPYKFEAPWTAYEFANHALASKAELVVLSTAWITRLSTLELQLNAKLPDLDTVSYWVERMRPLMGPQRSDGEIIVVFANRCGEDGEAPLIGPVRYAGSSTVMAIVPGDGGMNGEARIFDILGRAEEGVLIIDTKGCAKYQLKKSFPAESKDRTNAPNLPDPD